MALRVTGDEYFEVDGQLSEIKRQLRQPSGYPFVLADLRNHLQDGIEGRFAKGSSSSFLKFLGTVDVPAVRKFSAQRSFVVDTSGGDVPVRIGFLSDNFWKWFGGKWFGGKKETNISAETLRYAGILRTSLDATILKELGDTAEVKLAHIFSLMKLQPNGEKGGALLTDGWINLFYVRDKRGLLRAVLVHWYCDGWRVNASSVAPQGGWRAGMRVFSRNSSGAVAD